VKSIRGEKRGIEILIAFSQELKGIVSNSGVTISSTGITAAILQTFCVVSFALKEIITEKYLN